MTQTDVSVILGWEQNERHAFFGTNSNCCFVLLLHVWFHVTLAFFLFGTDGTSWRDMYDVWPRVRDRDMGFWFVLAGVGSRERVSRRNVKLCTFVCLV